MKNRTYQKRALLLFVLAMFIGGYQQCQAQSIKDLKGIPVNETGLSLEEYNSIMKHRVVILKENNTLLKAKDYLKIDIPTIVCTKNDPNKPVWSGIPYIIKKEDYENN